MIELTLPYSEELLDALFEEFNWEREDINEPHPVATGNCKGHDPRGSEIGNCGHYENAAMSCPHCYPGNPAGMQWNGEVIRIKTDEDSSKPLRALKLFSKTKEEKINE